MFGPLYLYPETGMGKGEVIVATSGSARAFGKVRSVPLRALACRQFGNLQLIAADPESLFEHWSAEQHQGWPLAEPTPWRFIGAGVVLGTAVSVLFAKVP